MYLQQNIQNKKSLEKTSSNPLIKKAQSHVKEIHTFKNLPRLIVSPAVTVEFSKIKILLVTSVH